MVVIWHYMPYNMLISLNYGFVIEIWKKVGSLARREFGKFLEILGWNCPNKVGGFEPVFFFGICMVILALYMLSFNYMLNLSQGSEFYKWNFHFLKLLAIWKFPQEALRGFGKLAITSYRKLRIEFRLFRLKLNS